MKKRVLSIDFDYFLDTDLSTRNEKFPDGIDEIPLEELDKQWGHFYNTYPEIKDIGVTDKFYTVCRALKRMTRGVVVISNSHKDIWDNVFNLISPEDEIEVTNIDFHHDNYISGGNKVDCANWVRHLMNERPNTELTWIRRSDSEVSSLTGEFPYNHIEDFLF